MNIELRHLRYFVAVAEESGFTAAAGRVHVTQQVVAGLPWVAAPLSVDGCAPAAFRDGLCPASAEAFSARPGTVFVPALGVPPTSLCVAWRAGDPRPAVRAFVKVATSAGGDSA